MFQLVTASSINQDDLVECMITQVTVTPDDLDGDGLSVHSDLEVYGDMTQTIAGLLTDECCNVLMPELLAQ